MAKGCKVRITTHVNGILRAGFYARETFPTMCGLNVVGTTVGLINVHDVRWADIYAMSASIAAGHVNKSGHNIFPLTGIFGRF
jgi:hypothetical protein